MPRNKYVGDYRLIEQIDNSGKVKASYEYIGLDYQFICDNNVIVSARKKYLASVIIGWLAFIVSLLPYSASCHRLYVLLPYIFSAVPFFMLSEVLSDAYKKEPLEHRNVDRLEMRLPSSSAFSLALAAFAFIADILGMLADSLIFEIGDCIFLFCLVIYIYCCSIIFNNRKFFHSRPC